MNVARTLRHLTSGRLSIRRAFPAETLKAIEQAIRRSEAAHEGEIVFVVEAALDTLSLVGGQTARERALEVFEQRRIWDTERNNGVLIYVLIADRAVEIVADRGIHQRAGDRAWQEICRQTEEAFRRGDYRGGSLAAIDGVGRHLTAHFDSAAPGPNELPDEPIVR